MLKTLKGTVPSEPPPAPTPSMLIVGFPAKLNANVDRKETLVAAPARNWNRTDSLNSIEEPLAGPWGSFPSTPKVSGRHAAR